MVVYFADHLAHSIQVDAIGARVEKDTLAVVHGRLGGVVRGTRADPAGLGGRRFRRPARAICRPCSPDRLLDWARRHRLVILLRVRVGEHVVAGTTLAWVWTVTADLPAVDPAVARSELDRAVRIGFERTLEQDAALGIRQLVDMACKALSPAVNDPYTAVQAVDHLSVIFCALAVRPLGDWVTADPGGAAVIVPGPPVR